MAKMFSRLAFLLAGILAILGGIGGVSASRRELMFDRRAVCTAFSQLSVVVTGGKCSGGVGANCKTVIEGLEEVKQSYKNWWADDGVCDEAKLKSVSESSARTVARVWLEATAEIKCDGQGYGCGYSISNSEPFVTGVGEALAAAADDGGGKENGFCSNDVRLLDRNKDVVIETARAEVCASGGEKRVFEAKFVEMLQKAVYTSFREATSNSCDWGEDVKSTCPATGKPKKKPFKGKAKKEAKKEAHVEVKSEVKSETGEEAVAEPESVKEPETTLVEEVVPDAPQEAPSVQEPPSDQEVVDAAKITDPAHNPILDEIIIGGEPAGTPPPTKPDGDNAVVEEDVGPDKSVAPPPPPPQKSIAPPSCTCAEDLCKSARCNAFPFATCKTVSNNQDCSDCSAKFFLDQEEVICGIGLCKPKGSICANKSLAQCCGVCCRCGSFLDKLGKKEGLELGFCQAGPICDCLSGFRG